MTPSEQRFELAKAALTRLLAGGPTSDMDFSPDNTWPENYAPLAVKYADALMAELDKGGKS
jgi:hypothetical protein